VKNIRCLHPQRIKRSFVQTPGHPMISDHRPRAVDLAGGDDYPAGTIDDRPTDLDAVAFEVSCRKLTGLAGPPYADQPTLSSERAGPGGDVGRLAAGRDPDRRRRVTV
jgi:hypothetical protein